MNDFPDRRSLPTTDLVELVRRGERAAADQLFERYGLRVLEIVRMRLGRKLRGVLESTDIRQQVLADAFTRLDDFEMRDDSSLLRWLARFVENAIRAKSRYHEAAKRGLAHTVPLPGTGDGGASAHEIPLPSALPTPSVEVGRAETADAVRDAIAELPERYREVILLRDYADSPWEEVGEELDLSPNAARMLHSRALTKLGGLLRELGIE